MKLSVEEDYTIELKEVFNNIKLVSGAGEIIYICMRDSGFEIQYLHTEYSDTKFIEAKEGLIKITEFK